MSAVSPPELVQLADATDGLDEFAPEQIPADDMTARSSMEEEPPELVWLVDATDGLNEFVLKPDRPPLRIEAPEKHADGGQSASLMDVPIPEPKVIAGRMGEDVWGGHPSRFDWVKRASRAALVCAVLAAAADGILVLQPPATPRSAVEPPEPAIDAPEADDPVELDGRAALAPLDSALPPAVTDPQSVRPLVVRTASSLSPRVVERRDLRGAPPTRAGDSDVRSVPSATEPSGSRARSTPTPAPSPRGLVAIDTPAVARETPAENTAAAPESPSLSTTPVAAAILAPNVATSAGASPPAVVLSPVVAGPSAAASLPTETVRSASTDGSLDAIAGPPRRELEARAIENVLGRYRNAFNSLDAGAAMAVWPTANEKTLARAFDRLEDQDVSFENCQIEVVAVLAEAACSGTARYVPKVGSRTPRAEARRWSFSLRKASGGWLIDRVDAR